MFKQDSKYRLQYLILVSLVFLFGSVFSFIGFYEDYDGMNMLGGIAHGLLSIGYTYDLYEFLKNKKRINS